jgi:fumarate reductase subunit C
MMGPLYFALLLSVVSHAFIGLYRLALKWGFMEGSDAKKTRPKYKILMKTLIAVYLILGLSSLAKYTYIGLNHDFDTEPRYKSQTINLGDH